MFVDIECGGMSYIGDGCGGSLKRSHDDCLGVDERGDVRVGVG